MSTDGGQQGSGPAHTGALGRVPITRDRPRRGGIPPGRRLVSVARDGADLPIDNSNLTATERKRILRVNFVTETVGLGVFVISLAYGEEISREADLTYNVCCLGNSHYAPELRPLTGVPDLMLGIAYTGARRRPVYLSKGSWQPDFSATCVGTIVHSPALADRCGRVTRRSKLNGS
jgi:hypothetical protein